MAYRVGSVVAVGDSASTTRVVTRPAGAALNDILVLRLYAENQTLTPSLSPGTWTKITSSSGQVGGGTPFEVHDYWSRQGAESGSITISWGGASVWNTAIAAAWDGRVTSGDPLDATATFATGSGTTATATGLSTANIDADIIGFASNAIGSAWVWTAGLTERADFGGQSLAENFQTQPGASGNKTATLSTGNWGASLIALRAEPQPAPPSYPDASIWRRQPSSRFRTRALVRDSAVDASQLVSAQFFEAPSTSDVTVALTGVSGTGAVGSLSLATSVAIVGNSATGTVGALAPSTGLSLVGVAGSGSVGALALSNVLALTGNTGTGAVGTIVASTGSPDVTVGLTGVSGTGGAGSVAVGVAKGLTGNGATSAVGTLGVSRTQALTGTAGAGAVGTLATSLSKTLTGVAGMGASGSPSLATSKALTGVAATGSVGILAHSRTSALTGVSGTGSAGTLAVDSGVVADPVEIVFTVRILRQRSLTAAIATTAIRTMAVSKMVTTVTRLIRSDVRLAHITKQVRVTEKR